MGVGVTPLYDLYGDVLLDRVWFSSPPALNRVFACQCVKHHIQDAKYQYYL